MPQRLNLELIRRAWFLRWKRHTQLQIGKVIRRSSRQVGNYLDEKWLAERGIGYLKYAEEEIGAPAGFLENQAWSKCQNADPSWIDDARYDGHAYNVEDVSEEMTGFEGSRLITVWLVRTCRFCGYNTRRRHFGYSIV